MKNMFPGTRTAFRIMGFFIVLSVALDVSEWAGKNFSGFGLELSNWVLFGCVFYAVSRFLIPAFGLMPVNESVSLFWAGFFFIFFPFVIMFGIIALFKINSPYVIGFLYFIAFIEGCLIHRVWNIRAFRTHKIIILREASVQSDCSLEEDKISEIQKRKESPK
ncbi:hypothetical protein KA005_78100 [bacterium]|nr:hypothetical protein [bacterium]